MNKEFVGIENLIELHESFLNKFEDWASKRAWEEFGPRNHFDWW